MPAALKASLARKQHDEPADDLPARRAALFSRRLPAAGLLVVIVGLSLFLVQLLKHRAAQSDWFRVDPGQVLLGELPPFVPDRVASEIQALAQVEPRSVFDATLLDDITTSVARHPWVRSIASARRVLPNKVALDLRLRAPAATVEVGNWCVTVDAEGWVLEDHASLAPQGLMRIRGDKKCIPRIPRVGNPFRCQPVVDGLAVVADLEKNSGHPAFRYLTVAAVDVTNVGSSRSSEIVLELANGTNGATGTLVDWGSAPCGALGAIEMPATKKLDNLLLVHDKNPGYAGVVRIHAASETPFVTLAQ